MKIRPVGRRWSSLSIASLVGVTAMGAGALLFESGALATVPAANAIIGNQATAAYTDSSGNTQLATSNLVQTQVQQVGSFNLDTFTTATTTVQNTKTNAAGTIAYAPHVLTNTGNGTDTFTINVTNGPNGTPNDFTSYQVFADPTGSGTPSGPALCTVTAFPGTCTITQTVAGNGGTFPFVVAYTLPATATTPPTPYGSGLVTAIPSAALASLYAGTNQSAADVDNVNLTTVAAFSETKAIATPAIAGVATGGTSSGGWPTALASGQRSAGACNTSSAALTAGCTYTVYTLNYKNTGGAAGVFYTQDTLPSGFTYVQGTAVWSNAPGQALDAGGVAGITFAQSGNSVAAEIANVNPNVSGSISFVVLVNNTAAVGTSTTTNTASYDSTTSAKPVPTVGTVTTAGSSTTNLSPFTVTATYGVVIGSSTGTAVTSLDTTANTPNGTLGTAGVDQTVDALGTAGGSVKFSQVVYNTGNASDTFNLSVLSNNFPAGTTFNYFAADGVTPLLDTNSDGTVDTGVIAAGASRAIVVQAILPASTPAGSGTPLYDAIVKATSVGNSTVSDTTGDALNKVVAAAVDLTNSAAGLCSPGTTGNCDIGQGPSPNPTVTQSVAAGTPAIIPLFVQNNDSGSLTYNLSASSITTFPGALPTGWTVTYSSTNACPGTGITTLTVAAGAQGSYYACVTPPSTQIAGTTNIYFQVQSTTPSASTNVIVSDAITDAVTVTKAVTYNDTLAPSNTGQIAPVGTVTYPHTLTPTGTMDCSVPTLTVTLPAADVTAGWTATLYIDTNNNGVLDAGDTLVASGVPLSNALTVAGGPVKYLVKIFAPGGAVAGVQDIATVTASFTAANGGTCPTTTVTDTSTVVSGQIRVVKSQALVSGIGTAPTISCASVTPPAAGAYSANLITGAKPGDCLYYQVVATNEGTAPVTAVTVSDAAPTYTAIVPGAPGQSCTFSSTPAVTGTPTANVTTGVASCGTGTTVPPGGTITLIFAAQINQN